MLKTTLITTPVESPDDRLLHRRLRVGETDAFRLVVEEHYQSVFRQLRYLSGSDDRAADLTQETFIQAWQSLSTFKGQSTLGTWLYTLAVRVWQRKSRQASRHVTDSLSDMLVDDGPAPDDSALAALEWEEVACAVQQLPEHLRVVVVLTHIQGMTHSEAANALRIPIGTVKSRLHTALCRLRQKLTHLHNTNEV